MTGDLSDNQRWVRNGAWGIFSLLCAAVALGYTAQEWGRGSSIAVDGITYVAATQLAVEGAWDQIYPTSWPGEFPSAYRARFCALAAPEMCVPEVLSPFIAPPVVLLLSRPLAALPGPLPFAALRLVGAVALMWASWRIWSRPGLAATAPALILLAPVVWYTLVLGQTSPLLFAAFAAGLSAGPVVTGVLLTLSIGFKVSPSILLLTLVRDRRPALLVTLVGVTSLIGLTSLWAPAELWAAEGALVRSVSRVGVLFVANRSLDAMVAEVAGVRDVALFSAVKGALSVGGALFTAARIRSFERRWAVGWLWWAAALSLLWWHYVWLVVGALAVLLGERVRNREHVLALILWLGLPGPLFLFVFDQSLALHLLPGMWILGSLGLGLGAAWRSEREE